MTAPALSLQAVSKQYGASVALKPFVSIMSLRIQLVASTWSDPSIFANPPIDKSTQVIVRLTDWKFFQLIVRLQEEEPVSIS